MKFSKKKVSADPEKYLRTDVLAADLKGRSIRGGTVTMASQACKFVLQFGATMVVARLLKPADFGLVAMVTGVTGFIGLFKEMGLSMATVQKAEINHAQVSTLFWVNVIVSAAFALLTILLAPLVAWFYNEPRLIWITMVAATGFVFSGLTVQHSALLNRQMRFLNLAAIDVTSTFVGNLVAVISAYLGAGYWSLVFMQLAMAITNAAAVWVMCGWRPGPPKKGVGIGSMLSFGWNLTAFNLVNYFSRNLDNILIGRFWGAQPLGLYDKAYQLLLLPLRQISGPIGNVALPGLSHLQQDLAKFRDHYLKALACLTFLTTPVIIFMLVMANELVVLVLGSQWRDSSLIFQLLAISAIVQPLLQTTGWLYMSTGRTDRMFRWGILSSVMLSASFVVGLPYGPQGVAFSYAIAMFLQTYPCLYFATRHLPITILDILGVVWKAFVASLLAGGATLATNLALRANVHLLFEVAICAAVMGATYIGIMFYGFGTRNFYLSVIKQLRRR